MCLACRPFCMAGLAGKYAIMKSNELDAFRRLLDGRGWHLRFREELEREFQQDYARRYLAHMQIAGFLGLIAFLTCGVLDLIFMPEMGGRTWFIRMAAGAPMLALLLLSLGRSMGERHMQPIFTIFCCIFAGGLVAISLNSLEPYNYYYYNSVTVVMVIVSAVSRIQFKWGGDRRDHYVAHAKCRIDRLRSDEQQAGHYGHQQLRIFCFRR